MSQQNQAPGVDPNQGAGPPQPPPASPPAPAPPPGPALEPDTSWTRYLGVIAAKGAKVEKASLAVVTVLVLLFCGFIIPMLPRSELAAQLRVKADLKDRYDYRIAAHQRWQEWQDQNPHIDPSSGNCAQVSVPTQGKLTALGQIIKQSQDPITKAQGGPPSTVLRDRSNEEDSLDSWCHALTACPAFKKDLKSVIPLELGTLCGELKNLRATTNTKVEGLLKAAEQAFDKWTGAQGEAPPSLEGLFGSKVQEIQEACQYLPPRYQPVGPEAERYRLCGRFGRLKDRVSSAQSGQELSKLQNDELPLGFLSLLGINTTGLTNVQLPLIYLPLFWSFVLLWFLLYVGNARQQMLNLYARAIRSRLGASPPHPLPPAVVDDLGGVPHAPWWWLAPLPGRDGAAGLKRETFRSALGWERYHFVASFGTLCSLGVLLILQFLVALIGAMFIYAFADGVDLLATTRTAWRTFPVLLGIPLPAMVVEWRVWIIVPLLAAMTLLNVAMVLRWLWPWSRVPDHQPNHESPWYFRRVVIGGGLVLAAGLLLPLLRSRPKIPTAALLSVKKKRYRYPKPVRSITTLLQPGFYRYGKTGNLFYITPDQNLGAAERLPSKLRRKRRRKPMIRLERRLHNAQVKAWRRAGGLPEWRPRHARTAHPGAPTPPPAPLAGRRLRFTAQVPLDQLRRVELETIFPTPPAAPQGPVAASGGYPWSKSVGVFAIEQEVLRLLREAPAAGGPEREKRIDAACTLLQRAIEHRQTGDRSVLRLFDLLAVVAHKNGRTQTFQWLIHQAENGQWAKPLMEDSADPQPPPPKLPESLQAPTKLVQNVAKKIPAASQPPTALQQSPQEKQEPRPDLPELAQRARAWNNPQSGWHRRWSKQTTWAGLPM